MTSLAGGFSGRVGRSQLRAEVLAALSATPLTTATLRELTHSRPDIGLDTLTPGSTRFPAYLTSLTRQHLIRTDEDGRVHLTRAGRTQHSRNRRREGLPA